MIACLRRVDCGDPVDSVLRDYPEEAGWLREHLIVSYALQMTDGPSAEKKSRARESLRFAVAQSAAPASVATRLRFGFALAPVVLTVVICLGLTAGAAAASGVNLRSFAGDVVDSLVEPLPLSAPPPLSAEGPQDPIGLDPGDPADVDDVASGEHATHPSDDGSVDADDVTPSAGHDDSASDDTNPPVQGGSFDQTNLPGKNPPGNNAPRNSPPADNPMAHDPPRGEDHGGDHRNKPDEIGPPAHAPSPGGPPDGHGYAGCDGYGDHGDDGQPGEDESNGNGSDRGEPSSSNLNPSNGANGDAPNDEGRGGSKGSNSNCSEQADEGRPN